MNTTYIKGQPGYCLHHKKVYGLISLIGFLAVITIFTVSYIILGTARNYFNIASVIILLPTAKFFVQYSMIPWKLKVDDQKYLNLKQTMGAIPTYCELLITGSEKRFEIMYLVIGPDDEVLAYSANQKEDVSAFQKAVVNFLNYYNFDAKAKLIHNEEQFFEECQNLAVNHPELTVEQIDHIQLVFEKISIMSI